MRGLIALIMLSALAGHAAELTVLPVQGAVYLVAGAGRNVVVQRSDQGLLVVDSGTLANTAALSATVRSLAGKRAIRYIIDTGGTPDAIGGNEVLRKAGATIIGGNVIQDDPRGQQGASVIAHENVQLRLSLHSKEPVPEGLLPTETFSEDTYDLYFNDEAVRLIHVANAHGDGDTMVFFRKSDVLVTGDVFDMTRYPVMDIEAGGSITGLIAALNEIIDVTVPRDKEEGGTIVIPSHGRLCDEADVVEYRDMVTIIRDRIQDMIGRKLSREQVRKARPTLDYDGRYALNDPGVANRFVDAIYTSLSRKP